MNLAILSPNRNAYSETFIQSHRELPFNIKFYYDGWLPTCLDSGEKLLRADILTRIRRKFSRRFTAAELDLIQSFRREKIDCILAEYGLTGAKTCKVAKYLGLPLVVHFHGFDASVKSVLATYKEGYRELFGYAAKVVVVSEKMRAQLIECGCPEQKLMINIYGAAPDFEKVTPRFDKRQFVAVGRFVDKKAPYLTLLAFKNVLASFPDAQLIMGGDGPLLNTCKVLAQQWGIENNVSFPGPMSRQKVLEALAGSIAFLQHSIVADDGDSEGTPVAIIEAQMAGLPVVATRHAGIPDVVMEGVTGLLVNELDAAAMTAGMVSLLNNQELAQKMGEEAKRRAVQRFTMHRYLDTLAQTLTDAVNGPLTHPQN